MWQQADTAAVQWPPQCLNCFIPKCSHGSLSPRASPGSFCVGSPGRAPLVEMWETVFDERHTRGEVGGDSGLDYHPVASAVSMRGTCVQAHLGRTGFLPAHARTVRSWRRGGRSPNRACVDEMLLLVTRCGLGWLIGETSAHAG